MKILEIIIRDLLKERIKTRADLDSFKRKMAKKHRILCPTNIELLKIYHELLENKRVKPCKTLENSLRTRPVRSLSGIVNVSVLTKPYPCPGSCIFCPSQKGIPKSYLAGEPAVQRAILNKFSPSKQVKTRLQALKETGHPIDKIELRIIGGTWSYYPKSYQSWFVKECFRAANEFSNKKRRGSLKKINLPKLQKINEQTKCRLIGITIETRPDYVDIEEIKRMRNLGITRVELGVQSVYDDVLKINKRGHTIAATIKATKLLKDAGFKVSYQMMLDLPNSSFERDIKMFEEIFKNPDFKPDFLKIYPLALVKQTPLYKWYAQGKFKPYSKERLIKLLIEIKKLIPRFCRIQRIIRDIPTTNIIEGGTRISNLREVVQKEMGRKGLKCKCIRCQEVKGNYNAKEKLELFRKDYAASGSKEIFLTFENKKRDKLYALLRLRIPSYLAETRSPPIFLVLEKAGIIREVHTYGQMIPVGEKSFSPQHRGLGKKLIREAEKITKKEFDLKKIAAISGVGARDYYRKLKYQLKDSYMVKKL